MASIRHEKTLVVLSTALARKYYLNLCCCIFPGLTTGQKEGDRTQAD